VAQLNLTDKVHEGLQVAAVSEPLCIVVNVFVFSVWSDVLTKANISY
jgi:hypothetical protein